MQNDSPARREMLSAVSLIRRAGLPFSLALATPKAPAAEPAPAPAPEPRKKTTP